MSNFKLLTQTSPWFLFFCLLAGMSYAWLLYRKHHVPWSETLNKFLFGLRFITVTTLCFLLTGPVLKLIKNKYEKPSLVFAIDNSQSLAMSMDSSILKKINTSLAKLADSLSREGINVQLEDLNQTVNSDQFTEIPFNNKTTNLDKTLERIKTNFENRNLAGVVLISDGIYNQGNDPLYDNFSFPIYSIGVGDTIPRKDINLKNLLYNKIGYSGNKLPLVAEIINNGFANEELEVTLKQGNKVLESKKLPLTNKSMVQAEFLINPKKAGLHHYIVETKPLSGEFTTKNNRSDAYIEVIDAKEKVLIVALSPHPDIKALLSAAETKDNLELEIFIPGISKMKEDKYDLIIFHQIPDMYNTRNQEIDKLLSSANSRLFIIGNQTNLHTLNRFLPMVEIVAKSNQKDEVLPTFDPKFEKFEITQEEKEVFSRFPPVTVPFADFETKPGTEIILRQKIGQVIADNPLLMVRADGNKKTALLAGEGIWEWRLDEFLEMGNAEVFDRFFLSLIQYLSAKEDKRKFRVYPIKNEYLESENVEFEAEIYNDVYKKIFGKTVNLYIRDEQGKSTHYAFTPQEGNSTFEIKGLTPGLYRYTAKTDFGGAAQKVSGEFVIREVMLEALNTTANFNLLRELSTKSNGKFFSANQINLLGTSLKQQRGKTLIHTTEEFQELINFPWIFFLILLLISIEWGIRKYSGGY